MAEINHIKNYFNKVGPLGASVDLGSVDTNNPAHLQNFQEALGAPSLSNYFKVSMDLSPSNPTPRTQFPIDDGGKTLAQIQADSKNQLVAQNLDQWLTSCGIFRDNDKQRRFELLATEATLPGTSMSVVQEVGSRQGIRERFATQRQYTDISIGFYVTSDYTSLRLFQEWVNYMNPLFTGNDGQPFPQGSRGGYPTSGALNGFHRFRYPNQYKRDIQITKFERDMHLKPYERVKNRCSSNLGPSYTDIGIGGKDVFEGFNKVFPPSEEPTIYDFGGPDLRGTPDVISYNFINAFPIAIQDIPLSYGNGQILQVQVDFSYDRYYVVQTNDLDTMAEIPLGTVPKEPLS